MGCIYIYTNKINGKQYVGQTTRALKVRHWQHMCQNETYFDRALNKYGEENFDLEILEDNIFDENELNEKEEYYISLYNTFDDGYNLQRGGNNKTRFNQKDRDAIGELIKTTNLSFIDIGEQTGYSIYVVSDINRGYVLPKENEKYPLRKRRCNEVFSNEDVEYVIYLLQNTDFTFEKIADLSETNFDFVADINRGKRKTMLPKDIVFPIRQRTKHCKVTIELGKTIIEYLKQNDKSAEEIGKILGIPSFTVGSINKGKHSICKSIPEDYPIRKKEYKSTTNYSKRKITDEQLKEIIDLLINTDISTEEIARRYNVDRTAINRINRGVVFKPITNKFKLPIRQNRDYNKNNSVA